MVKFLIFHPRADDREFIIRFTRQLAAVSTSPSVENTISLLKSQVFDIVISEAAAANDPALKPYLLKAPCLLLAGRSEDTLKEAIRQWPSGRYIDYFLISTKRSDLIRDYRVLTIAVEYAGLRADVENLRNSKESAEKKLADASSRIRDISDSLSGSLVKELEKRIVLEARYLKLQELKQKFEDSLRKLYAANNVSNLLDIVFDIKELVRAGGISIYLQEQNDTLGKYLKPLVWDDAFLAHADFMRHIALLNASDFAAFIARTGQELNITEPGTDNRLSRRYQDQLRVPLRSLLGAPLKCETEVIGLIEVYNKMTDGKTSPAGFTGEDQQILRDLSEHISIALAKLNLIQYDALTGLLRPDPFFEKVIQKFEIQSKRRQKTGSYAMVMGDVDWFKHYNDRNGHEAGNHLLRELSDVLKSSIREDDLLCRYGGEEFLVFLTGVETIEEAALFTERIRKAIEEHYFEFEEFQPRQNITMSFGVTLFPRETNWPAGSVTKFLLKKIVNEADLALAEAKGKKHSALKYNESLITKNKVCAFIRDKSMIMTKTSLLAGAGEAGVQEKRKHPRYFASTLCVYRENGNQRVANTIDLSLGGAKISTKRPIPPGQPIDLLLIMGNQASQFPGDVIYSQKASPSSAYFYTGIQFRGLSETETLSLENYFQSFENQAGAPA